MSNDQERKEQSDRQRLRNNRTFKVTGVANGYIVQAGSSEPTVHLTLADVGIQLMDFFTETAKGEASE